MRLNFKDDANMQSGFPPKKLGCLARLANFLAMRSSIEVLVMRLHWIASGRCSLNNVQVFASICIY